MVGSRVILGLTFWGIARLFSKAATPFYILIGPLGTELPAHLDYCVQEKPNHILFEPLPLEVSLTQQLSCHPNFPVNRLTSHGN